MLKAISYRNISSNADLFFGQFQLRHREFIERQHYAVVDRLFAIAELRLGGKRQSVVRITRGGHD